MGKRRPSWDYQHYIRYLKEGRGQGTGADYKPWIYIHDFPSRGVSSRIPGRTTGRIHHLLSRNEALCFYIYDADPDVLDIREQFPLRLSETMEIARKLNIRHPKKNSFPFVMTTDFLITRTDGLHARTVKNSCELDKPRVVEKFAIEQAYWSSRNVDWKIITEKQIPADRARNLQWLYSGEVPENIVSDPGLRRQIREMLLGFINEDGTLSSTGIIRTEEAFHLSPGSAVAFYKVLVLEGAVAPDLDRRIFF